MAVLSIEMNRFLGKALIDPRLLQQVLNGNRVAAMQGFSFAPAEYHAIMSSKAKSIVDLSRELCAKVMLPAAADAEMEVERAYQTLQLRERPMAAQYQKVVQRALDAYGIEPQQAEAVSIRMVS